jgi:hypothetical protein
MTFDTWMNKVDAFCWRLAGCSAYDLPDCPYGVWYDDGVKPLTAARKALRRAGW